MRKFTITFPQEHAQLYSIDRELVEVIVVLQAIVLHASDAEETIDEQNRKWCDQLLINQLKKALGLPKQKLSQ